jgi:hypothetical protein
MLVVKVELHSAITGKVTELYRMIIANDGTGPKSIGNYDVRVGRKLCTDDRKIYYSPSRSGKVENHRRLTEHVWKLVAKALDAVGYGVPRAEPRTTAPRDTTSASGPSSADPAPRTSSSSSVPTPDGSGAA